METFFSLFSKYFFSQGKGDRCGKQHLLKRSHSLGDGLLVLQLLLKNNAKLRMKQLNTLVHSNPPPLTKLIKGFILLIQSQWS